MLSYSEQNHLKAIYHLSNHGQEIVSTNAIADVLKTKPASVSDMLKKLSQKALLAYVKYQGVKLSADGKTEALHVIRNHRLWEVFLVEKLKFNWDEVHEVAEQLEHINSPLLTDRLDAFLGRPLYDPHGDPIPDPQGIMPTDLQTSLSTILPNTKVTVMGVKDSSPGFLQHLDKIGICLGMRIMVKEIVNYDASMELVLNESKNVTISRDVSRNIMVK